MAAASIFCNSAGVDTSKSRVIPLDALLHFLDHFQRENCGEDGAKQLITVSGGGEADYSRKRIL